MKKSLSTWPELPTPDEWSEALENLHLWSQIVGKLKLKHSPWINHSWHTTFYVSATGVTTLLIPRHNGGFEIAFNFIDHRLDIHTVNGEKHQFPLEPMTVADFYERLTGKLNELGITTAIYDKPVELPDPIKRFPENRDHIAYDAESTQRFWRALTDASRVFTQFRAGFTGKSSPVHFFWGAFDLAVTFFSGRTAPEHPGGVPNCADWVMQEAYNRELASFGFWPGTGYGEAAFYAYAYPEPKGYRSAESLPEGAYYEESLGEFLFPYRAVRNSPDPDNTLLTFLETTRNAAMKNGNWSPDLLK